MAACFVLEKLVDCGILLLAGTYGLILFRKYTKLLFLAALIFVAGAIFLLNIEKILNFVLKRDILHDKWLRQVIIKVSPINWILFLLGSLIIWFIGILAQYMIASSLSFTIPILLLIRISALTVIAGLLSGLPGGLGISQLTFTHLAVSYLDVSKELIGVFNIMVLLTAYFISTITSLLGLLILRFEGKDENSNNRPRL